MHMLTSSVSSQYIGRFAPSPTGPLHKGSLAAALASWLDARAQHGQWLVRIEDLDTPRCIPGGGNLILGQLAACGLVPDAEPVWQSHRSPLYEAALDTLIAQGLAYPCGCTRLDILKAIEAAGQVRERHGELVYPGTCRHGLQGKPARAWRFLTEQVPEEENKASNRPLAQYGRGLTAIKTIAEHGTTVNWQDRVLGPEVQNVSREVGDIVLKRADGLWAYQLAVVVDDAAQGITDIVRGQDLADNTARQILLQCALGLPTPNYLHTPLVLGANGEKLSKQNGAEALDLSDPVAALEEAGLALGVHLNAIAATPRGWLQHAVPVWSQLHPPAGRHSARH